MRRLLSVLLFAALAFGLQTAAAQPNGKLQIHYMDVGQGDGAVLISPRGQVVMFDNGDAGECEKPVAYLESLGVTEIDHHIASHYHADHIGCTEDVLSQFRLKGRAYDRGRSYTTGKYRDYVATVGNKRSTVTEDQVITLDANAPNPVKITIAAVNANGIATNNENDLSVLAVVEFGRFRASFGGDLSGESTSSYKDIETSVAPKVGRIDVYKVHHHCSAHSTNTAWLNATKPTIGIISVGIVNTHGHPAESCLQRLRDAQVTSFWTSHGRGAQPDPRWDTVVSGSVLVEVELDATTYTVTYRGGQPRQFQIVAASNGTTPASPASTPAAAAGGYVWARQSSVYHHPTCSVARNIKPENLVSGLKPPSGRHLHKDCPRGQH